MKYVLVQSRHRHKDIEKLPAIFQSVSGAQVLDFDWHKKIIHNKLQHKKFSEQEQLEVYVTGLTPVLISVLNYCRLFNIPIMLYHYSIVSDSYVSQSVI